MADCSNYRIVCSSLAIKLSGCGSWVILCLLAEAGHDLGKESIDIKDLAILDISSQLQETGAVSELDSLRLDIIMRGYIVGISTQCISFNEAGVLPLQRLAGPQDKIPQHYRIMSASVPGLFIYNVPVQ